MDIEKDESKHSRHKNNSGANIEEAINLDSDEDEDLHTVEHSLESKASYAPRAMSGGHLHMEQPESASAVSSLRPMWNYVDPQGNTRGPFPLSWLFRWSSFFDKDFKVWRTGETAEQAILLTDAFLMYL
uniref:GYF domain-containing protein n=1 Tax=Setaria viridis TaxID=4556 RepID=A0A4U6VE92_SETVI|nr:hypothetical protein SEVIR_3G273400v2 [Setaria viridis]